LFKPPSVGTISRSSGIVRFVQGGVVKTFRCTPSGGSFFGDASMKPRTSNTAHATIRWVGTKEFRPPWLRYNPAILVDSIPDLDMTSVSWDIVVREIKACSTDRTFDVTFQFASSHAPHDLLAAGLDFGLCEGPGVCVWRGMVNDTFVATRNPVDWYGDNRSA